MAKGVLEGDVKSNRAVVSREVSCLQIATLDWDQAWCGPDSVDGCALAVPKVGCRKSGVIMSAEDHMVHVVLVKACSDEARMGVFQSALTITWSPLVIQEARAALKSSLKALRTGHRSSVLLRCVLCCW